MSCAEKAERVLQKNADRKKAFAACLIAMEQKPPTPCMLCLTTEQQDAVKRFYNHEKMVSAASIQSFLEIGRVLCSLEDIDLKGYFSIGFNLPVESMFAAGQVLIEQARYETAAWFFSDLHQKCDEKYAGGALEKAAYAHYQSRNYGRAREQYRSLLIENKAEDVAARQYYEWSCKKEEKE